MILHHSLLEFDELIELTGQKISIPSDAIRKDYFITLILNNLAESEFVEQVVFKGGTSLSKCYPNSINRFSEDIDLTYIPEEGSKNTQINKQLKKIEKILIGKGKSESINEERNDRNKSSYVWFDDDNIEAGRIKLEIGSSVRPHPFSKKTIKTYIQEYLEENEEIKAIEDYKLKAIEINVLDIERTFVDKILSVKRHAVCGTLRNKVRHIYDVVKIFEMKEIQEFLREPDNLKRIIRITKDTDSVYLEKRNIPKEYDPLERYNFEDWQDRLDDEIKSNYESLHKTLLYTNEKQEWGEVFRVFNSVDRILNEIGE